MISLHAIRSGHSRLLVALLWFHAALAALVGWTQHAETTLLGTIIDVAIALVATLQQRRTSPWLHLTLSVGAMAGIAVLLAELAGHPWQIDAHMYFFAVLALLIGLCDWRAIVTAATVVAGHHLVLGLTAPHYVFHGGSHLGRIVLHAVILAVEAGAAIFLCRKLVALVGSIEQQTAAANEERHHAEALARQATRLRQEAARFQLEQPVGEAASASGEEAKDLLHLTAVPEVGERAPTFAEPTRPRSSQGGSKVPALAHASLEHLPA